MLSAQRKGRGDFEERAWGEEGVQASHLETKKQMAGMRQVAKGIYSCPCVFHHWARSPAEKAQLGPAHTAGDASWGHGRGLPVKPLSTMAPALEVKPFSHDSI